MGDGRGGRQRNGEEGRGTGRKREDGRGELVGIETKRYAHYGKMVFQIRCNPPTVRSIWEDGFEKRYKLIHVHLLWRNCFRMRGKPEKIRSTWEDGFLKMTQADKSISDGPYYCGDMVF